MKRKIDIYEQGGFGGQDKYMRTLNLSCTNFLKYVLYTYREVTPTMKYVKTFSFQVHPLQPTLMELFTFATKALQLLGTKLANKEHSQFHFQKLFCFKQHFRRSPNLNTISGRSTAYNVQERPSIKTALMLTLCEKLFEMCRCWTSFHYLEASWFVLQKKLFFHVLMLYNI